MAKKEVRVYPITDPNLVNIAENPSEVHVDPNNQTVESTIQETPVIITVNDVTVYSAGVQGPAGPAGAPGGEDEVPYAKRTDFENNDTIVYRGEADPGSADASAVWRIKRITFNAEGDATEEWADGNANFDNVWNDRATLSYS